MVNRVLCVAAHADDEALGCGGTLARHCDNGDEVTVLFVADGVGARVAPTEQSNGAIKNRKSQAQVALNCLGVQLFHYLDFPDNQLDQLPLLSIIQAIESVMQQVAPNIIYTHHVGDLNVDHQLTAKAVLTAARPLPNSSVKRILGFEVMSSTGWSDPVRDAFMPQVYVDIKDYMERKMAALDAYQPEMREFPHARSVEAIVALTRFRGAMVGREHAEAFTLMREIW